MVTQNENIERYDQEKFNKEESPNTSSNFASVPRRSTCIKKAMDRYGAVSYK